MKRLKDRLAKGNAAAFTELFDQTSDRLYRYLIARFACPEMVPDIIQEVFMRLVKHHKNFRTVEHLDGYVFSVARNEAVRALEKANKHPDGNASVVDVIESGHEAVVVGNDWIQHQMNQLSESDQEIIQLKIFGGLTFEEIASAISMPCNSVSTRYRRAILQLKAKIEKSKDNPVRSSRETETDEMQNIRNGCKQTDEK
ncbi:sigma-70 family RNA polymerase sigma factor [bacterium]|nr:sigma-70 family RNA polymerase sigma factor [bacterium]